MAIKISPKHNEDQLQALDDLLKNIPGGVDRAITRALNKTVGFTKAEINRIVLPRVNVKKKDITLALKIKKATPKDQRAVMNFDDGRLPLYSFGGKKGSTRIVMIKASVKQSMWLYHNIFKLKYGKDAHFSWHYTIKSKRNTGASYEMEKGVKKYIRDIPGGFYAVMKNGHKGFFKRKKGTRNRITMLMGPSIGGILNSAGTLGDIEQFGIKRLAKQVEVQAGVVVKQAEEKAARKLAN